ncbi:DUF4124 domain-containing protein [Sedimenticola sp.]|uniref:DUF4124 domain-containing protein n=1 Tax=Sedimenticola sp. TaxID=1940285 RepID=UPI003D12CF88
MNRRLQGRIICIGALLLGVLWLTAASAAVYRWVDEQGRTQFGDRPPVDQSSEELPLKLRAPAQGNQPPATEQQRRELRQKMLDAYQQEREEKRQARKKRAAEEAKRKRACIEAKDRVREYESAAGLYDLQADGTRRYLSDKEFRESLRKARDEVKRLCRSGD